MKTGCDPLIALPDDPEDNVFITQATTDEPHKDSCGSTTGLATQLREGLFKNAKTTFQYEATPHVSVYHACSVNDNEVSFYGLPAVVKTLLDKHHGITELYDWQKECLSLAALTEHRNLIYSLPTSGGKTLVAEILMLKEVLCSCKNALFIFPFVSIVQEKVRSLMPLALELGFVVEEYAGSRGQIPPRKRRKKNSVYIATIEKAHLLISALIELERTSEIGIVVVDELHMLFEGGDRGANLEVLLTKIKLFTEGIQIVGMSATINRINDVARFLNAEVFQRNFRPVKLQEFVKVENKIYAVEYQSIHDFNIVPHKTAHYKYSPQQTIEDPDQIFGLVCDVLPTHSCLIFCPTKKHCQNLAQMLCRHLPKEFLEIKAEERHGLLNALVAEVGRSGLCPVLKRTIPFGIAYHHSGLTMDERKLIEDAYSYGVLYLLTCTSTLAAGVNLPAKRVIVRAPYVGAQFLSAAQYKQMVGRAGRAGLDSSGESVVIIKSSEVDKFQSMLSTPEENSSSSLFTSGRRNLLNVVLDIVGLKRSKDMEDLKTFVRQTLYSIQNPVDDVFKAVDDAVNELLRLQLLSGSDKSQKLTITPLGLAVVKSGVEIHFCIMLQDHLKRAVKILSLLTHLHLLYLVTPYDLQESFPVDPHVYYSLYTALSSEDQETAALIGVPESCVIHLVAGRSLGKKVDKSVVQRFYLTLALYDLWRHKPLADVAHKFHTHKGTIHNLLTRTASFASCVCKFTQEIGEFWSLADLLPTFVKQLQFCCHKELLPLMEIPAVKQGRARQLYQAGYKSVLDVAKADAFEMSRNIELLPRKVAQQIISAAKMLLFEQAEALQEEALDMVEELQPVGQDLQEETLDSL